MKLAEASLKAKAVCTWLAPFCERLEIAGSIRRQKAEVGDIDLVAIPKKGFFPCGFGFDVEFSVEKVWADLIPKALRGFGFSIEAAGSELLRCYFPDGFQLDIFRARPETWGVILLVKTGSKEHNVKLCSLARSKGLMLSASDGVISVDTPNLAEATKTVLASRTEEDIFKALGLPFVAPENREVW